jgi:N-methylhydantoinase A
VTGTMRKPPHEKIARGAAAPARAAAPGQRKAFFGQAVVPTPTGARAELRAGNRINGPALIEEYASTTVLWPGDRLSVDPYGNLIITIGSR